jgi:hypothetical protein
MSLLDRGNADVLVFPEEEYIDADGNRSIRPSTTGIPARVLVQALPQSGTSARRAEQDNEGFESEQLYRMRFTRRGHMHLGLRSQVEWNGERWSIFGLPIHYQSGARTAHSDYVIKRA